MRSRPELKLYLTPRAATPGCRLQAEAVLDSRSETPIEGVEFRLRGVERRHTGTVMVGNVAVAQYANQVHTDLVGRTPATILCEGEHRFAMSFEIPATAPPSYRSKITVIEYELRVRVIIPWWPDRSERYMVPVVVGEQPVLPAPASFCTDGRGPQGSSLYLEASLEGAVVPLGGVVSGAASIANVEHHRIRRVEVSLVANEHVAGSGAAIIEIVRYTVPIHEGAPPDSRAIPFRVRFPEDAIPSFRGALIEIRWSVEIRAVIAFGSDRVLTIPIEVVRSTGAGKASPAAPRVPPVGRERRAIVWAEIARRHGFENDAEDERMTLDLRGGTLAVTLEARPEGGLATVAKLSFPALGIGLSVTEKRWTDALSRTPVEIGPAFDARFTARGREAAQVLAFLDEACCRALLLFERASVDDRGAVLHGAETAQSVEDLDRFVTRAMAAAQILLRSVDRVPAPAAMAARVGAWRSFAELVSGRLQIGGMAIHDAVFEHRPFSIVTEWGEDGAPSGTSIRLFRLDAEGDQEVKPELPGPAKAIAAELASRVASLDVSRDRVEARLPGPLDDPRAALPLLEALSKLAEALRGDGAKGPYR